MGRPGRKAGAVGEKTRSLLLSAAATEFYRHGYHDTKISSIVSKAGLTQPNRIKEEIASLMKVNLMEEQAAGYFRA